MTELYSNGMNNGRSVGERFSIDKIVEHFKMHKKIVSKITVDDSVTTREGTVANTKWNIETEE